MNYMISLYFFLSLFQIALSEPHFVIPYQNQLCSWQFGSQPNCDFRPLHSPARVAIDAGTNTVYWLTSGAPNALYRNTSGTSEELLFSTNTSTQFIRTMWIDSPNYIYISVSNMVPCVWRIPLTGNVTLENVYPTQVSALAVVDDYLYILEDLKIVRVSLLNSNSTRTLALKDPALNASAFSICPDFAIDLNMRTIYTSYGEFQGVNKIYSVSLDQSNQIPTPVFEGQATGLEFADDYLYAALYFNFQITRWSPTKNLSLETIAMNVRTLRTYSPSVIVPTSTSSIASSVSCSSSSSMPMTTSQPTTIQVTSGILSSGSTDIPTHPTSLSPRLNLYSTLYLMLFILLVSL